MRKQLEKFFSHRKRQLEKELESRFWRVGAKILATVYLILGLLLLYFGPKEFGVDLYLALGNISGGLMFLLLSKMYFSPLKGFEVSLLMLVGLVSLNLLFVMLYYWR